MTTKTIAAVSVALAVAACGGEQDEDGACFWVQVEDPTRVLYEVRTADGDLLGRCDFGNPVQPRRDCVDAAGAPESAAAFEGCE